MLQIIDDDDQQEPDKRPELFSIELLLDYLIHEISCRNNFEFVQAVIRLFLKVFLSFLVVCVSCLIINTAVSSSGCGVASFSELDLGLQP